MKIGFLERKTVSSDLTLLIPRTIGTCDVCERGFTHRKAHGDILFGNTIHAYIVSMIALNKLYVQYGKKKKKKKKNVYTRAKLCAGTGNRTIMVVFVWYMLPCYCGATHLGT